MAEGWLKEVEEDATYIQTKRFQDQVEENKREAEKRKLADEKLKADANKKENN